MKRLACCALALCLSVLPFGAGAQDESIEVAHRAGPAVWRLTNAAVPDAEVWVLGTVGAMPRDLDWNKDFLADLMDGARAVVMPPQASVDLVDAAWFLIWHGDEFSLPRGQTLEAILPENVRTHFIAVRISLGQDEEHYATDIPLRAIIRLQGDFQRKYKIGGGEPGSTIRSLARRKRIAIAPAGQFEVMDLLRAMLKLPLGKQSACLALALDDIDRMSLHADIAARAWAVGDFKTVRANFGEYRFFDCVTAALQSAADLSELQVTTYTGAIYDALLKPGKTIVAIGMGPWLRDNGVLARLAAQPNISVDSPPE